MTGKLGPKGQVVIPKSIRDRLGLNPGDEVVFVRIEPAGDIAALAGAFADFPLTSDLEAEHRRDLEQDVRREHGLGR
jgi:AbrB family looped-hinge helix DNA binding protein